MGNSIDVYEGPKRPRHFNTTVKQDRLLVVNTVEDSPVPVHPEGQDIVPDRKPLRQSLGPVAGAGDEVGAGVLWYLLGAHLRGVVDGEAEAQGPAPAVVHGHQLQAHLLVQVDGPVGEGDAVAEAVPARGLARVRIQPHVLALGLRVEARRLRDGQHRASLMAAVGQAVVGPAGHRAGLVARVCKRTKRICQEGLARAQLGEIYATRNISP